MIQDIEPKKFVNHYDGNIVSGKDSLVLAFRGDELLMKAGDELKFPKVGDFEKIDTGKLKFLFSIDKENFFLLQEGEMAVAEGVTDTTEEEVPSEDFTYKKFRTLRERDYADKSYVFAAFTAYQLNEWYSVTKYCGKCGAMNDDDKTERARVCPKCGNKIYPRINPAVIIGITDKDTDRIILTRYRTGFGHNALVAGFTEIGETLEGTVAREAMEEVGLKVKNIRYYKSQPWGIASDILAGFFCDVDGDKDIKMDSSELKYAEWVAREDIVLQPVNYSLTNEMMQLFKREGYQGTVNM